MKLEGLSSRHLVLIDFLAIEDVLHIWAKILQEVFVLAINKHIKRDRVVNDLNLVFLFIYLTQEERL